MRRFHRWMHLAHQYQVLIAIIVASLIFSAAWTLRRSPLQDPKPPSVARSGSMRGHDAL